MSERRIARAQDAVITEVDVDLLLERFLHVDLGDDPEALLLEAFNRAAHGLVEPELIGDGGRGRDDGATTGRCVAGVQLNVANRPRWSGWPPVSRSARPARPSLADVPATGWPRRSAG